MEELTKELFKGDIRFIIDKCKNCFDCWECEMYNEDKAQCIFYNGLPEDWDVDDIADRLFKK